MSQQEAMHNNHLLIAGRYLLRLVRRIRHEGNDLPNDFRQHLMKAIKDFETQSNQHNVDSKMIYEAKYAFVALLDEVILNSDWPGKNHWMTNPLQLELFGEHLAGEGFFNHLSELRQSGSQYVDVLEVYYVCMQLGFFGKYRLQEHSESFQGLQADLRSQIEAIRGIPDRQLSQSAVPKEGFVKRISKNIPIWVMFSVLVAGVILLYITFSFMAGHQASQQVSQIKASNQALTHVLKSDTQSKNE